MFSNFKNTQWSKNNNKLSESLYRFKSYGMHNTQYFVRNQFVFLFNMTNELFFYSRVDTYVYIVQPHNLTSKS